VASGWSTTYDRLFVIDAEGKVAFKGTKNAKSQVADAKAAIQDAINRVNTPVDTTTTEPPVDTTTSESPVDTTTTEPPVDTTNMNNTTTSVLDFGVTEGFELKQNYPNPMRLNTTIEFSISERTQVTLSLFDITGKIVSIPIEGIYQPGDYNVQVQRNNLQEGIYFYRLNAGDFVETKRMIIQ
ncbi:MAG: T9SS type A sorting domain-containing protein, partial [Draconibacterium sp.]|nr:T9SS type A sorting domain-containing protein [Draconibacterium sp.]